MPENVHYNTNYDSALLVLFIPSMDTVKHYYLQSKYQRKVKRKDIQLIPLKVVNQSESTFIFTNEYVDVLSDFELTEILDKAVVYKELKQKPISNIPYFLIGSWFLFKYIDINPEANLSRHTVDPKYILKDETVIIPFSIGIMNIYMAIKANKNLTVNLDDIYLHGKEIKPGGTVYGVFAIKGKNSNNVLIRAKE